MSDRYANLDALAELGLTANVSTVAALLPMSRAAAYRAAERWRETHGQQGLPVIAISDHRMVVAVPALIELLRTGVFVTDHAGGPS